MSRIGMALVAGGFSLVLLALLGLAAGPSYADGRQRCLNQGSEQYGQPVDCAKVNGTWVASVPDLNPSGGGIPGAFVFLFLIAALGSVGFTVWKVTTARTMARQSGMDPGLATKMTLFTENGLDATYLASSLRPNRTTPAATPPPMPVAGTRDASSRLTELKGLLDQGVVTQAEYDARRQAIIDSV
jgi:hypothetical protein